MRPSKVESASLAYPKHRFDPEELLHFIETNEFVASWRELGLSEEDELFSLEMAIMADPKAGDVIQRTGGVRKLRFAPESWKTGKRGGLRVCYVYLEDFALVILLLVYSKIESDDLTSSQRKGLRQYIEIAKTQLEENGPFRVKEAD